MDTLAFSQRYPLPGCVQDSHPMLNANAGYKKRGAGHNRPAPLIFAVVFNQRTVSDLIHVYLTVSRVLLLYLPSHPAMLAQRCQAAYAFMLAFKGWV